MEYTNSEMKLLIQEHLHSSRDRAILYERLVNGMTYETLAEKFAMSERQIKNIVYKAQKILFDQLHS